MAAEIPRPKGRIKRFFGESTPYDLALAVCALPIGGVGVAKTFEEGKKVEGLVLLGFGILIFVLTISKHLIGWLGKEEKHSPHHLESPLHVLHSILLDGEEPKEETNPHLRLTIHVPINNGQKLEQVLEYVGDRRGRLTVGRTFPAHCGIIGLVFRTKEAAWGKRKNGNYAEYIKELVKEWGYTEEEAKKRDQKTMSWFAIPLFDRQKEKVIGVVYIDSVNPDFFDQQERRKLVLFACVGIARFVGQAYN